MKQKREYMLFRRLLNVATTLKRTKRALIGLCIIAFFIVIAAVGPTLTPYHPVNPRWIGYYPAGDVPLAQPLCVPSWYRILPWYRDTLSENMDAITDYQFSQANSLSNWNIITESNLISVQHNADEGTRFDGCIEIKYTSTDPTPKKLSANLTYTFNYPFRVNPEGAYLHLSYFTDGRVSRNLSITLNIILLNGKSAESLIKTMSFRSPSVDWASSWFYVERTIFSEPGNYTLKIVATFRDDGTNVGNNAILCLDNINIIFYGNAFGLLGTDDLRRDIFTSLMHGARVSVMVGLLTSVISVSIGLVVGLIAGYMGKVVDEVLMRLADFLMTLPGLPLLITLAVILRPSIWNIIFLLSFLGWMGFSRNIRSMTLSLRERAFVEAAKAAGAGKFYIAFKHILPNVFPLVYLALAVSVPSAITAEASLSFLGLFDPSIMTWGRMLNEFQRTGVALTKGFSEYWFWILPPGIAISALAISFILVGYSMEEILNPRLRARR